MLKKITLIVIYFSSLCSLCSQLSTKEQSLIENRKKKWGKFLQRHPFQNRQLDIKKWKALPSQDRPDLAAEQDILMTMDPTLKRVPYERKWQANEYVDRRKRLKSAISGVNWVERGPTNVGGRTRMMMFDPNDATHKKMWAGGVCGGLWYTNDITATVPSWNKVNDLWDNMAISSMAYDPSHPNIMYVGTGEAFGNLDAVRGGGIWRTLDSGKTWTLLSSTTNTSGPQFYYVTRLVVKNNGMLFAATKGSTGTNGGIMRSVDSGKTWTSVLTLASNSYACDLELSASGDLFASFGIGTSGSIYRSRNSSNGASGTWFSLNANIVVGSAKRIEMACAPSNGAVLYAVANGASGKTDITWFKYSLDTGNTWTSCAIPVCVDGTGNHFTSGQGWYNLTVQVHPTNPFIILAGGLDLHRSLDTGKTWTGISHWYGGYSKPYVHADNHFIQSRPGSSNEFAFSNDGGVFYSTDAGNSAVSAPSFSSKNTGYNVTQFYSLAGENGNNSHYFIAGAQDNGTHQFSNAQLNSTSEVTGGDGAFCHVDQLDATYQISSYVYNSLYLSKDGGNSFNTLINESSGNFINPTDYDDTRKILYAAANKDTLKRISSITGTPVNTNIASNFGGNLISAVKVSPYNDVVFLGIASGRIYKVTNASTASPTFTRIDNGTTPITTTGWVSSIDVGVNDNQILVAYSNYGVTSLWETSNGGTSWYSKEGTGLPDIPVRWGIYNPNNRDQVLLATEVGVWSTDNFQNGTSGVPSWGSNNSSLANVRCDMLQYRSIDGLVSVATHGRGLFTSDIFVNKTIADFTSDNKIACSVPATINFKDASLKPNNSWAWDINADGTVDYTIQNPSHTYTSSGLYSVKLAVNGGTKDTFKNKYVLLMSSPLSANTGCALTNNSNASNGGGIGISRFTIGTIDNKTSESDGYYNDYSCSYFTILKPSTTYSVSITTGVYNAEGAVVYIDYNNNSNLETSEVIGTFPANTAGYRTITFTTPVSSGLTLNTPLRLRVLSRFNAVPTNACNISTYGQAEDYTVYFMTAAALPISLGNFSTSCQFNKTKIQWSTYSEFNNDYFTIEKSEDGIHFERLVDIKSQNGNSKSEQYYQWLDSSSSNSIQYYRLKQTDIEGGYSYSRIIYRKKCTSKDSRLELYPNPAHDVVCIDNLVDSAHIDIYSLEGSLVFGETISIDFPCISIRNLSEGSYLLKIRSSDGNYNRKLEIIRK